MEIKIEHFSDVATVLIVSGLTLMIGIAAMAGMFYLRAGVLLCLGLGLAGILALTVLSFDFYRVAAPTLIIPGVEAV
jgi:L-alanine-DL-glutamate epimerase-like enolase superfamily enzyme